MSSNATGRTGSAATGQPPVLSFHHPALRCIDAEETRHFYEDILGIPLAAACVFDDDGFGNPVDFMHIFHRMGEGDFLAFFDIPDQFAPDLFKPYGSMDLRLGLKVLGEAELAGLEKRLTDAGIDYKGPVDHGYIKSIYLKDPNGLNLEIAAVTPDHEAILSQEKAKAKNVLDEWVKKHSAENTAK